MGQKSNYKILNLVGRGQFGKVFAAIERSSGNLVALKELTRNLSTSSFLRELNFLVSLNHFNIVHCRAIEHQTSHRYLVMDYCEGGTLRNLLQTHQQLTLNQSLKLVIDVLRGLEYAHDQGIIHRDIKPENILLKLSDRFWTAHISDFGIAKLHQEINPLGVMGNTGSPAYMAPEQFYGQYSYSCDLYAVGILLYELVVGEPPFLGMPKELLAAHLNQPVLIPTHVPYLLKSAIAKSLQKIPSRRFASAAEMLDSLELVQTILETDHYSQIFNPKESRFKTLIPAEELTRHQSITHLAISKSQVYLASGVELELKHYQDSSLCGAIVKQHSITLDKPIRSLRLNSQGCWLATCSSLYYLPQDTNNQEFQFFLRTFLPVASFPTNNLVFTAARDCWLAVSYLPYKSKTPILKILKSPSCREWRSQINRQLWNFLVALDRRCGLGIYQNQTQHTEFHLFNRRGNWLANFTLQIQLDLIVHHLLFDQQILATEENNSGMAILISLKKFSLKRIEIEIQASLATTFAQGYLLSDLEGRIVLIDGNSHRVRRYQIPLPPGAKITAIATSATQLLVASTAPAQSYLQRFSWQNIES